MNRERGVALVVSMWILALGGLLAYDYSEATRTETRIVAATLAHHRARAAAEAGIWKAVYAVTNPDPDTSWPTNGVPVRFDFNSHLVGLRIQNVQGLADLNHAGAPTLLAVVGYALGDNERAATVVERIIDWRDADDIAGAEGAEKIDYEAAGYNYAPRNGAFTSREELGLIMELSRDEYERIAPFVTVYSQQSSIHERVAPLYVHAALGQDSWTTGETAADQAPQNPMPHHGTFEILAEAKVSGSTSRVSAIVTVNASASGQDAVKLLSWRESWPVDMPMEVNDELGADD